LTTAQILIVKKSILG